MKLIDTFMVFRLTYRTTICYVSQYSLFLHNTKKKKPMNIEAFSGQYLIVVGV